MVATRFFVVLFLLALLGCGSFFPQDEEIRSTGTILDSNGNPIAGASVQVNYAIGCCDGPADLGTVTSCGSTDEHGRYDISTYYNTGFEHRNHIIASWMQVAKDGFRRINDGECYIGSECTLIECTDEDDDCGVPSNDESFVDCR